jgi:hypothetical protein
MQGKSGSSAEKAAACRLPRMVSGCIVAALMVIGSCSGSDSSWTINISFNQNGLTTWIALSRPVQLPLDEEDAAYVMISSGCSCIGTLELVDGWWQFQSGDPGCTIRIQASSGDVECSG